MLGCSPFFEKRLRREGGLSKRELDRVLLFYSASFFVHFEKTSVLLTGVFDVSSDRLLTVQFVVLIARVEGHVDTKLTENIFIFISKDDG